MPRCAASTPDCGPREVLSAGQSVPLDRGEYLAAAANHYQLLGWVCPCFDAKVMSAAVLRKMLTKALRHRRHRREHTQGCQRKHRDLLQSDAPGFWCASANS